MLYFDLIDFSAVILWFSSPLNSSQNFSFVSLVLLCLFLAVKGLLWFLSNSKSSVFSVILVPRFCCLEWRFLSNLFAVGCTSYKLTRNCEFGLQFASRVLFRVEHRYFLFLFKLSSVFEHWSSFIFNWYNLRVNIDDFSFWFIMMFYLANKVLKLPKNGWMLLFVISGEILFCRFTLPTLFLLKLISAAYTNITIIYKTLWIIKTNKNDLCSLRMLIDVYFCESFPNFLFG